MKSITTNAFTNTYNFQTIRNLRKNKNLQEDMKMVSQGRAGRMKPHMEINKIWLESKL